ncbi:unnamed protein product [Brachionus calyciflorus]|uniref:Uncharacterized protein n=1 Tax=Brachionus calyciflorus TaxID=104777 RepID=A0A813WN76_9BILA|nr:unnamed protein product [Brachionus calyciflorus]
MSAVKFFKVPIEIRVDFVTDNRHERADLVEFIENNGCRDKGGLVRIRTIKSKTEYGKASVFLAMKYPFYNGWLLEFINKTLINRNSYRAFAEEEVMLAVPDNLGQMPNPSNIYSVQYTIFNRLSFGRGRFLNRSAVDLSRANNHHNQPQNNERNFGFMTTHINEANPIENLDRENEEFEILNH